MDHMRTLFASFFRTSYAWSTLQIGQLLESLSMQPSDPLAWSTSSGFGTLKSVTRFT
jgi:hypothetical protein